MHGGASLRGSASPSFRHGRYSSAMPSRVAARYGRHLLDPELLSAQDEVALLTARIDEVLGALPDEDEAALAWEAFAQHLSAARSLRVKAGKSGEASDVNDFLSAFDVAWDLYTEGMSYQRSARSVWDEVTALVETRRRVVGGEVDYRTAQAQIITRDQMMGILGALIQIIQTHVNDRATIARIQDAVVALVPTEPGR